MPTRPIRHPAVAAVIGFVLSTAPDPALADDPWIVTDVERITSAGELRDVIVVDGGHLVIDGVPEPGVRIRGNLWALGTGRIEITRSVVEFASRYHGQYALVGIDDAVLRVTDSVYRVTPGVQHGLVAAGDARLEIADTTFGDVQLVAADRATVDAARLDGSFEVIVQNAASVSLEDIPRRPGNGRVWVWVEIGQGTVVDWSPPLPGFIDYWSWPPPSSTGVPQTVTMTRCETLLWPMLVREGSDLTLRDVSDDAWVVVGLHLPDDTLVDGLVNHAHVVDDEVGLPDRRLRLVDARVDTWNLYPQRHAVVHVRDSVLGEILSFDDAVVRVERSVIDGSGGFVGAQDRSRMTFSNSRLTCTVEATDAATLALHHAAVEPYPADPGGASTRFAAWDEALLVADHTTVATTPAAGGEGTIAVVWVEPTTWPPPSGMPVELWGTIALFGDLEAPALGHWQIDAIDARGHRTGVADGHGNVEEGLLGTWNDPVRDARLVVTLEDTAGRRVTAFRELDAVPPPRSAAPAGRRRP